MTVIASKFVEKHIVDYLERLDLKHCWLFNFNVIKNTEAFLRTVIFSKYSTVGFVINVNRKEKAKELVEISKKYNVVAFAYLSEMIDEPNFLVCVKSK